MSQMLPSRKRPGEGEGQIRFMDYPRKRAKRDSPSGYSSSHKKKKESPQAYYGVKPKLERVSQQEPLPPPPSPPSFIDVDTPEQATQSQTPQVTIPEAYFPPIDPLMATKIQVNIEKILGILAFLHQYVHEYASEELSFISQIASLINKKVENWIPFLSQTTPATFLRLISRQSMYESELIKNLLHHPHDKLSVMTTTIAIVEALQQRKENKDIVLELHKLHYLGFIDQNAELGAIIDQGLARLRARFSNLERVSLKQLIAHPSTRSALAQVVANVYVSSKTAVPTSLQFHDTHFNQQARLYAQCEAFDGCRITPSAVLLRGSSPLPPHQYEARAVLEELRQKITNGLQLAGIVTTDILPVSEKHEPLV